MKDLLVKLRLDVEALTEPGERLVGHPGHHKARAWLLVRVREAGLSAYHEAYEWPYEVKGEHFANVLARLPGHEPELAPMLVAAHYDTCGLQPGADDNAAAIAILLNAVGELRRLSLRRDVIFAFFDAEEPPHSLSDSMGSIHYYRSQRKETTHFAMVLDLCGHDVPISGREDLLFITGTESASELLDVVRANNALPGLRTVAVRNDYIGDLSDHHAFRLDHRPYLFLTCGRWPHYHATTDTADRLNYAKMIHIGEYVVRTLAQVDSKPLEEQGEDTTPLEVALIREHLSPLTDQFGLDVKTRSDVDVVVHGAMSMFGV
jgi:hypothetical protein